MADSEPQAKPSSESTERIGWAFLSQYYSFLNKDPSRLHCFYTKRSTLLHSTEGEDASPCFGQQEIHAKIMSLGFEDCKVYISNVDSQGSAENGIIVQVIGEMSNRGGDWRKFAQTFFLAEQPNGYFVLNDICRYIKEEDINSEPAEEVQQPETARASTSVSAALATYGTSVPEAEALVEPTPASTHPAAAEASTLTSSYPSFDPAPAAPLTNGVNHASEGTAPEANHIKTIDASAIEATVALPTAVPATSESQAAPTTAAQDAHYSAPSTTTTIDTSSIEVPISVPTTDSSEVPAASAARKATATPPASAPAPAEAAAAPAVPKTWAWLASKNVKQWGTNALDHKGVSASASASRPTAKKSRASTSTAASTSATPTGQAPSRLQTGTGSAAAGQTSSASTSGAGADSTQFAPSVQALTHAACFVKGVVETVHEDSLKQTLESRFGTMKEFDIIRNKACAFIEFDKLDSARRAIQASLRQSEGGEGGIYIDSHNGQRPDLIHIVTRKEKGDRPVSTRGKGVAFAAGEERGGGGRSGGGGYKGGSNADQAGGQQQQHHHHQQQRGEDNVRGGRGASRSARGGRGGNKGATSGTDTPVTSNK